MSNKIPEEQAKTIKEVVFREADQYNYLAHSRAENSLFLSKLVRMPSVGGVLGTYISKAEIKTYIKDAILNRYSKEKRKGNRPSDLLDKCRVLFNVPDLQLIEKNSEIQLLKSQSQPVFIVISEGTYLKWETALRKALLYVAGKPFGQIQTNSIHIVISVFARHMRITPSEKDLLEKALSLIPAKAIIWGE